MRNVEVILGVISLKDHKSCMELRIGDFKLLKPFYDFIFFPFLVHI